MTHSPLIKRLRVLAAKIETTAGTPVSLAASDAQFIVMDPTYKPNIDFNQRPLAASFSHMPGIPGARGGTLTFSAEATPHTAGGSVTISAPKFQITDVAPADRNGIDVDTVSFQCNKSANAGNDELSIAFAGTPPAWASTFLPACGWVASGNTYSPKSEGLGTSVKALTMGCYCNGRLIKLAGAVGTFVVKLTNGKPAVFDFSFTGVWQDPTDVELLAPTWPTVKPVKFLDADVTVALGSVEWQPVLSEISIDAGNSVVLREDATNASGYISGLITSRRVTGTMNPEAPLVATEDLHGNWTSMVEKELTVVLT